MLGFSIGKLVKVRRDNDNENYDSFRNEILVIKHVARNKRQHPGYDEGMSGMPLYDFETVDGKDVPCSLYHYEVESV